MTDWLADVVPHSISEIETFLRCSQKWYYRYRLRLPEPMGQEAEWGVAFHAMVEAYYTGEPVPVVADDLKYAWTIYHEAIAKRVKPLTDWVERWVTYTIGGIPFRGRIDLVDVFGTIRDTKTKKRRPAQNEVDDSLQLTAYWEAFRQITGERPKAVAWDVLVRNKVPIADTFISDRAEQDVARLTKIAIATLEAADKGHIWPNWGTQGCAWCAFRDRCIEDNT